MSEPAGALRQVDGAFDLRRFTDGSGLRLLQVAPAEIGSRFCAWRGQSERRYVMTMHAVDAVSPCAGLPEFEECVVLAVGRGALGRHVLDVSAVERGSERRAIAARGTGFGAVEWHIYFVGQTRAERAEIVADLRARHGREHLLARCA